MKTVRAFTFETNSSSCHAVTILSDREYNNIKNGKGFICKNSYVEISKDSIKDYLNKEVKSRTAYIKAAEEDIEKIRNSDCLKKVRLNVFVNRNHSRSEMIEDLERYISRSEAELKKLSEHSVDRLYSVLMEASKHLDVLEEYGLETYQEEFDSSITEDEYNIAKYLLQDYADLNTYGGDNDVEYSTRIIDGIKVHVLSYAGWDY